MRGLDVSSGLRAQPLRSRAAAPFSFNNAPKNLISINQAWQVPSDCGAVGVQDVSVRLTDVAGNTASGNASLNIVDTTNPAVTFRSPPSIATTGASFNVPVRLSDAGSGAARLTLGSTCGTVSDGGVITINNARPSRPDLLRFGASSVPSGRDHADARRTRCSGQRRCSDPRRDVAR